MRRLRGSVGCLAVVLAAMGGCSDSGPEAPRAAPVMPGSERSALLVGTPELVHDLQPAPPPSPGVSGHPGPFAQVGTTRFFVASDPMHGAELWKTDGTPGGTVLVTDLVPGAGNGGIRELTAAHGVLYFLARDTSFGDRLWRSDGTAEGTGPVFTDPSFLPLVTELEAVDGTLYLSAAHSRGTGTHLWASDGTREGTRLLKAFSLEAGSEPLGLRGLDGRLHFTANDGVHGREPWTSDGTPEGTVLVKDLAPGAASSTLWEVTGAGDVLYFTTAGALWKSDGTPEGTVPLTNVLGSAPVVPGGPSLRGPGWLKFSGGTLYFSADDGTTGYELWKSDGTPAGTVQVKDIHPSGDSRPSLPSDLNGVLLFLAWHPDTGREVWTSDGTADGTVRLTDIQPGGGTESVNSRFAVAGSRAYFFADRGGGSHALWTSDGTPVGTRELRSLAPGGSAGLGEALGLADGSLLFAADDGVHGVELWTTDGTPEGTRLLRDIGRGTHGGRPRNVMDLGGGRVLFSSAVDGGLELWSSDGTEAGTRRVLAGVRSLGVESRRMGGVRYFAASTTGGSVDTLWRSDGTPEGTFALQDFPSGLGSVVTSMAGRLFFSAATPTEGWELWASDGTREGTVRVKDILPGPASSHASNMLAVGGTLYFSADDGVHGRELWKSDGTEAGTVLVKDLVPGVAGSAVGEMENLNGSLVFTANDDAVSGGVPSEARVLWRVGPEGQPRKIVLSAPGQAPAEPDRLRVANGTLLILADTYLKPPQLWSYDGTSEHATQLVKDRFSFVLDPTSAGRVFYFLANNLLGQGELWRSDGTAAGTSKVTDANQTQMDGSYHPSSMLGLGDRGQVLLRSWAGATGVEMWASDGSEVGTSLVADLSPGPSGSDPRAYTRSGDSVFFSADDGVHGAELWRLTLPPVPADTTPPGVVCPAAVTVEPTSSAGAIASWWGARVSDDVTASIPLTYSHLPGTEFPLGTTEVTVTARDDAGNTATCSFEVRVRDTLAPSVSCPADVEVEATRTEGTPVSFAEATASDGVMVSPEVTYSHAPGSAFPVGETEVTATATDAAGNSGTCTFLVTVRDTTAPGVSCPEDTTAEAMDGSGAAVSFRAATASDAVTATPEVTYSHGSGGTFALGETRVTATARDAAGNASSCSFSLVVRDTTAPVLTCPADMAVAARGPSGAAVEYPVATAEDAVTARPEVTYSLAPGSTFPVGTTPVTATGTDAAGNTASCSFHVTVRPVQVSEGGSGCAAAGGSPAGLLGLLLLLAWPSLGRARTRRS